MRSWCKLPQVPGQRWHCWRRAGRAECGPSVLPALRTWLHSWLVWSKQLCPGGGVITAKTHKGIPAIPSCTQSSPGVPTTLSTMCTRIRRCHLVRYNLELVPNLVHHLLSIFLPNNQNPKFRFPFFHSQHKILKINKKAWLPPKA